MKREQFRSFRSSTLIKSTKIVIGISIFILFIRSIDIIELKSLIINIDIWDILILFLLTIARNVIGAVRFRGLISKVSDISLFKIMEQYFVASFYNNFLPTAIGGDTVRMVMLTKEGLKKEKSVIYVIAERIIGFYALLFISFINGFFWDLPCNISKLLTISFLGYSFFLFIFSTIKLRVKNIFIQKFFSVFEEVKKHKITLFYVFYLSVFYQLVSIFLTYFVATSIGITGYFFEFFTLVPIVWFLTMIPFSFGGLGIREISFALLLGLIGISAEQATIISLGTYFTLLLSGLLGGILILRNFINIRLLI